MKLYLLRHCDAGDNTQAPGKPDPDRPLTDEGKALAAAMAKHMRDDLDLSPKSIVSSPLLRALQTARAVRAEFTLPAPLIEDGLGPSSGHRGATLAVVVKKVASDPEMKRVVMVSHHDTIALGLRALNLVPQDDVDPIAKGELRVLDIDRDTGTWEETHRCLPSILGFADEY